MNILFYSSFNSRARDAESLMLAFKNQGHNVMLLTQLRGNVINEFLRQSAIRTVSYEISPRPSFLFILRHIFFLVRFCTKEKVDIVYCHLETPSFVGVLSQFFIRSKVYVCRHHIDEALLYGFDKSLSYKLTYRLAKKVIVVSNQAKAFMITHEKIDANKIIHINLAYDFKLFKEPNWFTVSDIKNKYKCDVLLVTVGRLTKFKRPDLSIKVLQVLYENGVDAKLVLLGSGEMQEALEKIILDDRLSERVFLTGYVPNVLDYMASADFLIHPSILESSCVVVKEAGLIGLPVIVCKGVGDFDEFLINERNAFLVDKDQFVEPAAALVRSYSGKRGALSVIAKELKGDILRNFNIDNIINSYTKLNI